MITKTQTILAIATLLLLFSCNTNQEQLLPSFSPKVVVARGYVVPKDSMAEPKVIPAGKPKVEHAGKPEVMIIKSNVHPAGIPRVVKAGVPKVCTPGQGGCSLPETVPAIDRPYKAGVPEVVTIREPYDPNLQGVGSFSTPEGLRTGAIICMLEDKSGNIWFGGGGASKYDGTNLSHLTEKEGLNGHVWNMLEDKSGNIWFATLNSGISKYDGRNFTHFTTKEGLSNNQAGGPMLEDKSGNLWFGTSGGANKYDGKSFTHFTKKEGLSDNGVTSIVEDRNGNLWFGSDSGVSKYDGKSFTHFAVKEGLGGYGVGPMLEDKSGNLWIAIGGAGVDRYDGKSFAHFTVKEGLIDDQVREIKEDKSGNLWFATWNKGMCKYDGKSFTWFTTKEGLSDSMISSILEDKRGDLWFGTYERGVNKYNGKMFTHFTVKEGPHNHVRSIMEDKNGSLWFGTWNGGVSIYNGKSFDHLGQKEGLSNVVVCMLQDKNGNVWFGDYGGLRKYDGKNFSHFSGKGGPPNPDVHDILEDKSGNLWLCTWGGVIKYDGKNFTHFTEKQGLSNNIVNCMLQDKSGNFWFGTTFGGINKYDGKTFTHFTEKQGLSNNNVISMLEDKSGNLWFGTAGGGVNKYDGKTFTWFTEKEGLSGDDVAAIMEDKSGNLWFGTGSGFSKLGKDKLASLENITKHKPLSALSDQGPLFKTYTYEDGFSGIGVNMGKTMYEAKDGTIWIASRDRLTAFHPDAATSDTIAPNIQLTGLTLFNENIAWQNLMSSPADSASKLRVWDTSIILGNGVRVHDFHFDTLSKWYGLPEHISLPYDNNYLTFKFPGITLRSPKKVKYQYKLEGFDKNWSALTKRNEMTYGNLPYGNYTFKVKAVNGDGYWSKEFDYAFTIRPPWWQTWWFRLFIIAVASLIIVSIFQARIKKIRKDAFIQNQLRELEMKALKAQMNPHFIYNALNSIQALIANDKKTESIHYIGSFSRLLRQVLENSENNLISLDKELETIGLYIQMETLRLDMQLQYKKIIPKEVVTEFEKTPPLILQPFVENALWHGLSNKQGEKEIKITIAVEDGWLLCDITDNGIGRIRSQELKSSSPFHQSRGIDITLKRLIEFNDDSSVSPIEFFDLYDNDKNPCGTRVTVSIKRKIIT